MKRENPHSVCTSTTKPDRKSKVIVYLGYHKTASKWIWQHLFVEHYCSLQVNLYEQSTEEIYSQFSLPTEPIVLRQRVEGGSLGAELPGLTEVIEQKFPEASIVIGIRSQRTMLASHYGQYVANGGRLGFSDYVQKTVKTKWHYYGFLAPFLERLGSRILVYLLEDLRNDPFQLLCRLRNFVGEPPNGLPNDEIRRIAQIPPLNPQRNDLTIDTMLLLNRLRMRHEKNTIIPELRRPGNDHILVEMAEYISRKYTNYRGHPLRYRNFEARRLLQQKYGPENRKLSKLLGRSLSKSGYPT